MMEFDRHHIFINGHWQPCASGETLALINPSTGEHLADIARGQSEDIDAAANAAEHAMAGQWGGMSALERGRILTRMGQLTLENLDILAQTEAQDVGKPLKQAKADVLAMARYFEFYGGACDKIHGDTIPYQTGYTVLTLREPHGVTAHIVPWNYPMQILGRSVGGALAMGNACVVKPAEQACLTALMLCQIARDAGLPDGALNLVTGLGEEAGAALASHKGVRHISFTGSVAVGKKIQKYGAENIVPVTLELGGKSPQLVFDDADLDAALPFLINAGIQNAGQTCSASSRILVQRKRFDEVCERMAKRYQGLVAGPAMEDHDLGPLVSQTQHTMVQNYIQMAHDDGLNIIAQGKINDHAPQTGYYVAPTLIADTPTDHCLACDEVFGPLQAIIPFDDEAHALTIANNTDFGLVASVWTRDGARQLRCAKKLQAGQVFINNYGAGGGVELPFGGVKHSGHGREKGFEALYGFSTTKTIAIHHGE